MPRPDERRLMMSNRSPDSAATEIEGDRMAWLLRHWREVAADVCSHEGVGKSCSRCRTFVSEVVDEFMARAKR